jgi:hypothetical protein
MDSNLKSGYPNTARHVFSKVSTSFLQTYITEVNLSSRFSGNLYRPFEFKETIKQCYEIGYLSLP